MTFTTSSSTYSLQHQTLRLRGVHLTKLINNSTKMLVVEPIDLEKTHDQFHSLSIPKKHTSTNTNLGLLIEESSLLSLNHPTKGFHNFREMVVLFSLGEKLRATAKKN